MPGPHDKIIANAARTALGPLGFRRKGQSRTWLVDHGWWLGVVEFQPSSWSKGSYLNVAAHWLWSGMGTLSFDFGGRLAEFVGYTDDAQFTAAAADLAQRAANEAQRFEQTFISLNLTADALLKDERSASEYDRGGWRAYHAGVTAGLVGRTDDAVEMFGLVLEGFAPPDSVLHSAAERMSQLAQEPPMLRIEVMSLIEKQREALRLPLLASSPL